MPRKPKYPVNLENKRWEKVAEQMEPGYVPDPEPRRHKKPTRFEDDENVDLKARMDYLKAKDEGRPLDAIRIRREHGYTGPYKQ